MSTFPAELDPELDVTLTDIYDPATLNELDARIRAIEAKVGIDRSQVATTLDRRVRDLETGGGSVLTTDGDLLTVLSGALARLPVGANGKVLTVVAGVPQWLTAAGGGTHDSGTLADRPTSPSAGDSYEVTSGLDTGAVYTCVRDGFWTFVGRGVARRFASGLGFELVSPGSNADAGTSVASYQSGGVGRLALATSGVIHDATGCLIRRPIEPGNYGHRASVRLMARGSFTGSSFAGLYVSNSAGTSIMFVASGFSTQNDEVIAGNWSTLEVPGIANAAPWDGATLLTLQIQGTAIQLGFARGSAWTRWSKTLGFTPAFVGVCGLSDGAASNSYDFADFSLETFG